MVIVSTLVCSCHLFLVCDAGVGFAVYQSWCLSAWQAMLMSYWRGVYVQLTPGFCGYLYLSAYVHDMNENQIGPGGVNLCEPERHCSVHLGGHVTVSHKQGVHQVASVSVWGGTSLICHQQHLQKSSHALGVGLMSLILAYKPV